MLSVREGTRHPGHFLIGPINHLVIAFAAQPVGPRDITGMSTLVGHLAHRYGLEARVGGPLDPGRVNTAIDEVVLPINGEVVVHVRIMEKMFGVVTMLEVIIRMRPAEMVIIAKREAMRSETKSEVNADCDAVKGPSAVGGETRARRQRRPAAVP